MNNKDYLEILLITLVIIAIILLASFLYNGFYNNNQQILTEIRNLKVQNEEQQPIIINKTINPPPTVDPSPPPPILLEDPLVNLDRRVVDDPLIEPSRRPPRHVIMPVVGNPYFNYPTRGFTDSYSLQGYLIRDSDKYEQLPNTKINKINQEGIESEKVKDDDDRHNKILKLFGREKYPNSTEYEYYVSVNTGFNDNIKYFLENQRKELYDGDSVYIDILKSKYRVKLLKNRSFEYNPYLI
jgi:hypothetical protein